MLLLILYNMKLRFGIVAGIFLAIFCLYPQFKMLYLRGDDWNGHYAYNDIDEVAYASYARALIDGRPRRNDPYSGRDDSPETPQPESLFSIQFAAPYTIAIPARVFGIGTPWAMTLSGAFAGFLAALATFWLLFRLTGSNWYAMAGTLVVFAGGALFAGEGALPEIAWDGFSYPYFPGFRRYIPAMGMPAIFALFGLVWKLLSNKQLAVSDERPAVSSQPEEPNNELHEIHEKHETNPNPVATTPGSDKTPPAYAGGSDAARVAFGLLAVISFAYCVYSYFYIWTTAAAWLACVGLGWLIVRPEGWKRDLKPLAVVGAGCIAVLIPYGYLLSKRADTLDHVQLLIYTRAPDLFRLPEYISLAVLLLLIYGLSSGVIAMKDRSTLFALSLALVPIVIFNQQIITGRSLQPIHYQVFIGNYVAGLALMVTVGVLWRRRLEQGRFVPKIACAVIALAAIVWGFFESHYTVRVLDEANIERDKALPVGRRLEDLAKNNPDPHRMTVLSYDGLFADDMPSIAPQNILWARHQHIFAGLSWQENKERYYQFLYYSNVNAKGLDYLLKNDFVSQIALFGWGRHSDRLSFDAKPLTYREIAEEVGLYGEYIENFSAVQASNPVISYVVVPNAGATDLSKLEEWYELAEAETVGEHTIYRAILRGGPIQAQKMAAQ